MKTLFVLRHGKAERDSDSGRDFDRPLAERGWRDAEAVGREMRARRLDPEAVLASPAKRAVETVVAWGRGYGPLGTSYEPGIYEASADRLLNIVKGVDDSIERLLIVGHNPGFEDLIVRVAADATGGGLPTAAMAAIEFPVEHWNDVGKRNGRIVALIVPRELD
jgi:phosphohistidine phosphatase